MPVKKYTSNFFTENPENRYTVKYICALSHNTSKNTSSLQTPQAHDTRPRCQGAAIEYDHTQTHTTNVQTQASSQAQTFSITQHTYPRRHQVHAHSEHLRPAKHSAGHDRKVARCTPLYCSLWLVWGANASTSHPKSVVLRGFEVNECSRQVKGVINGPWCWWRIHRGTS
jgi:hypothetical protein